MGFTVAIGPIAAVVLVGFGVSMALSALDEYYGITDKVIAGLDDIGTGLTDRIEQMKQKIYSKAGQLADSAIDYAVDSARVLIIDTARHTLDKFLPVRPRLQ